MSEHQVLQLAAMRVSKAISKSKFNQGNMGVHARVRRPNRDALRVLGINIPSELKEEFRAFIQEAAGPEVPLDTQFVSGGKAKRR